MDGPLESALCVNKQSLALSDRVLFQTASLCSPGRSRTQHVAQASLVNLRIEFTGLSHI
ncbi:rCG44521 [Rattus norvegicus]|uniref:RCG44521 n=1 Tax=Rattus norvegicus TaxID=10116 RepID=A6I5B6_RAT|nr:rCG44521 [Rattus norvegicus]